MSDPLYSGTTSDGEPRPVRKVKAPSETFMKTPDPAAPVPEMVDLARRPAPWEPGYAAKR